MAKKKGDPKKTMRDFEKSLDSKSGLESSDAESNYAARPAAKNVGPEYLEAA